MVSAGERQPKEAPMTSSLPTLASTGSCARLRPACACAVHNGFHTEHITPSNACRDVLLIPCLLCLPLTCMHAMRSR